MSNAVIQVQGLGKRYRISAGGRPRADTLGAQLAAAASGLWTRVRELASGGTPGGGTRDFWALRDVSFDVQQGEVLGVVGHNGAGKSTLLKLLSRITDPTEGSATIRGRVASLLEVGTGFHDELTGRANVFFSGSILGMRRAEIARKFDEIVEFAGVADFIDTPIKRYSSGMKVRLGFAVAAHLDPEILIVDEVLAVGDATFQKRCVEKMGDVASQGHTILVVTHNMELVRRLTTRCLLLEDGRVAGCGPTDAIIDEYLRRAIERAGGQSALRDQVERPDKAATITAFQMRSDAGLDASTCAMGEALNFNVDCLLYRDMPDLQVVLRISTFDGRPVYDFMSVDGGAALPAGRGPARVSARMDQLRLYPGLYNVAVELFDESITTPHAIVNPIATLQVIGSGYPNLARRLDPRWGVVYETMSWTCQAGGTKR